MKLITSQLKRKKFRYYGQSTDLELESLIDLIDFVKPSKYTSQSSIHFDRYKLTKQEEFKFNKKFKIWLKSLVVYNTYTNYKYLLDFLIRKYQINIFNQEELIFLTLINKNYYTNDVECFPFLKQCRTFNSNFIVDCCNKHYKFFDLIFEYLDYVDYFVDELLIKYHFKYKLTELQLEIIKNKNLQIYNQIIDNIKKIIFNNNAEFKITTNEDQFFEIFKNKKGRELFHNYKKLIEYIKYLNLKNFKDDTIDEDEFNVLNGVVFNTEITIGNLESVKSLLTSLDYKYDIIKNLYKKFKEVIYYDSKIYDFYDKESILEIINENNFKDVKLRDKDILVKCLSFTNFDPDIFKNITLEKNLVFDNKIAQKNYELFYSSKTICNDNNTNFENFTLFKDTKINSNLLNYEVLVENYNQNIKPEIKDDKLIYLLCENYGYNKILEKYNLEEIKSLNKHNHQILDYCITRFEFTDIVDLLIKNSGVLIFLSKHSKFKKVKILLKEITKTKESCLHIFDAVFKNIQQYKNDLDLIEIYDRSYNFINNYKDNILENFEVIPIYLFDWLINNTEYDDVRIINKISKKIIEQNLTSINVLFKKYGNIMLPFLDFYLQYYNVYDINSLYNLNPNKVFEFIIKFNKLEQLEEFIVKTLKTKECDFKFVISVLNMSDNKKIIFESLNYLYKTGYEKFFNDKICYEENNSKTNLEEYIYKLFKLDKQLFLVFSKYYSQKIKNDLFNIILEEENFDLINEYFCNIELKDENIIYKLLTLYYMNKISADNVSYVSCNLTNLNDFNNKVFSNLEHKEQTLNLIFSLMTINKNYKKFYKQIHEEVVLLINSKDEKVRNISNKIYALLNNN